MIRLLVPLLLLLPAPAPVAHGRPVDEARRVEPVRPPRPVVHGDGSLQAEWIGEDAKCIVHVDIAALLASQIGGTLLDESDPMDLGLDELEEFKRETGMDPRRDFMSITMYATSEELAEDGVIIAVTSEQADVALRRLLAAEELNARRIDAGGHDAYAFSAGGGDRMCVSVEPAGADRRRVVLAHDPEVLAGALDVIEGRAPHVRVGRGSILAHRPMTGSIVFVAAGDLAAIPVVEPASEILRLSRSFAVDVGEIGDRVQAEATVSADDARIAGDIAAVCQGMIAMGRLIGDQDPELRPLRRLVAALDVDTNDTEVTIRFTYDAAALLEDVHRVAD